LLLTKESNETKRIIGLCINSCDKPGFTAIGDTCISPEVTLKERSFSFNFPLVLFTITALAYMVMMLFHHAFEQTYWIFHAIVIVTFALFSVLLWKRLIYQTEHSDGFNDGIIFAAAIICTFSTLIAICFTISVWNRMKSIIIVFRQVGQVWQELQVMKLIPVMVSCLSFIN